MEAISVRAGPNPNPTGQGRRPIEDLQEQRARQVVQEEGAEEHGEERGRRDAEED